MNAWHLGISPSKLLKTHQISGDLPLKHSQGKPRFSCRTIENWYQPSTWNQDPGSASTRGICLGTHTQIMKQIHIIHVFIIIYMIYNIYLFSFIYTVTYTCIIMYLRHTIHTILKISSISMDVLTVQCDLMWLKTCALGWGLLYILWIPRKIPIDIPMKFY